MRRRPSLLSASVALAAGAFFFCGCESGKPAETAKSDPCHPKVPYACESDSQCAPYHCKSGTCEPTCSTVAGCSLGFVCTPEGTCVKAGTCGTCSNDYDCPKGVMCNLTKSQCEKP